MQFGGFKNSFTLHVLALCDHLKIQGNHVTHLQSDWADPHSFSIAVTLPYFFVEAQPQHLGNIFHGSNVFGHAAHKIILKLDFHSSKSESFVFMKPRLKDVLHFVNCTQHSSDSFANFKWLQSKWIINSGVLSFNVAFVCLLVIQLCSLRHLKSSLKQKNLPQAMKGLLISRYLISFRLVLAMVVRLKSEMSLNATSKIKENILSFSLKKEREKINLRENVDKLSSLQKEEKGKTF